MSMSANKTFSMNIYISASGKAIGPLSIDGLHSKLQSGEATGSTPALVEGWGAWKTVREVEGVNPLLIPPPSASALGGIGEAVGRLGIDFGRAPSSIRLAVIGLGVWWASLAIAIPIAWITSHSFYFGTAENVFATSTILGLPIIAGLLSGAAWARSAVLVSAGVALGATTFLPDLTSAFSSVPALAMLPGIAGKVGLVIALISLLKNPNTEIK